MGQIVEFESNGGTATGYLAIPEKGNGPGVIVIQEWWGLVDHIKDVCDRFAKEGYVALASDLYHGRTTKSPDCGKINRPEVYNAKAAEDAWRRTIEFFAIHL